MRQRNPRQKSEAHLAWLRTLPSLVPGAGPVEAAHVRYADLRYCKESAGMGEKSSDCFAVPLAAEIHRDQHRHNERTWWESKGINPVQIAVLLWAHSGNDDAGAKIVHSARSWPR